MTEKPVQRFSPNNGECKIYSSIAEAARENKVNESSVRRAIKYGRKTLGYDWSYLTNVNDNENSIDEFDSHLLKLGISKEEVSSVKFWQTQSGEIRYSVVKNRSEEDSLDERFRKLEETLSKTVKPEIIPYSGTSATNKALLIHSSDKHVGAMTSSDSMYKNPYDAEEFENRMNHILEEIEYQVEIHGKFDLLLFSDLGDGLDGLDGYTLRRTHKLEQNMTNNEMFDVYVKVHLKFFDRLMRMNAANKVAFYATADDNHSGAFGYAANRALEIYLNLKYPQIETKIIKQFIGHFMYGNHAVLLCHGKDRKHRKFGLPLTLDDKTINFINDYIQYNKLESNTVHFIKGDKHQSASQLCKFFRYRSVLSLHGGGSWTHNNHGNTKGGISYDIIEKYGDRVQEVNITF